VTKNFPKNNEKHQNTDPSSENTKHGVHHHQHPPNTTHLNTSYSNSWKRKGCRDLEGSQEKKKKSITYRRIKIKIAKFLLSETMQAS